MKAIAIGGVPATGKTSLVKAMLNGDSHSVHAVVIQDAVLKHRFTPTLFVSAVPLGKICGEVFWKCLSVKG